MRFKRILFFLLTALMLLPLFCACAFDDPNNAKDFNGKIIGVLTGSIFDTVAEKNIRDPQIMYFNSNADLAVALESGKIDAYVNDEPVWRLLSAQYPNQKLADQFSVEDYGFIFPKNSEKSTALCAQFNEFLADIKKDGTLKQINEIWFGDDESVKTVDMTGLSAENGTLSLDTTTAIGAPFAYLKDNDFVGYDIDIAVRFCRKYGYGIKINDNTFSGMIANVSVGKSDFGAACITKTDERKESVLFSDANYVGGSVLVFKEESENVSITSIEQLYGKKIAVQSGSLFDDVAKKFITDCKLEYYNNAADLALALDSSKAQAYIADEPIARALCLEYPTHHILKMLQEIEYAFVFPKSNPGSKALCDQFNTFLRKARNDGTIEDVDSIWFGTDLSKQTVDTGKLTGENGTLTMAVSTAVGKPFCYMQDGKIVGYDVDIAVRFCEAYGYALKIMDYDVSGMFSCLSGGKCDFSASSIAVLEERRETMLFADPDYIGGGVLVVKNGEEDVESGGFIDSIIGSFQKTFLREKRYILFLSGLGTTVVIVLLSLLLGTLLGFLVYLCYYHGGNVCRKMINALNLITENTPAVVILMIIYYVVFGSVDISGVLVAVIGFTLIFTCSVIGLLKVGVGAVDGGQKEAALALGYTETQAFFRIILPQAAKHFLPGYKSAIIQLVKGTAIVGYIAVQDLTKVSEIVRSRTYEAFFPLIATAIIYFVITMLIINVINRIELRIDPSSRKRIKMLKGVKLK